MKQSTLDLLTEQEEHQRPLCFLIVRKAELPNYGFFQWAFYCSLNSPTRVLFFCYGAVKLFFSILIHTMIFYKQKYVALFTKHSGFHIPVKRFVDF